MNPDSQERFRNRERISQIERVMRSHQILRDLREQLGKANSRNSIETVRDHAESAAGLFPDQAAAFNEVARLADKRLRKRKHVIIGPRPPRSKDIELRKRYDNFRNFGGRSIDEFAESEHLDPKEVAYAFDRLRKAKRKAAAKPLSVR